MHVLSFDAINRNFKVEVKIPHCVEPSTAPSHTPSLISPQPSRITSVPSIARNCFFDTFLEKTYYLTVLFFCAKVELFSGGVISIDPYNLGQCNSENFNTSNEKILSFYESSTNKMALFGEGYLGSSGWNSRFFITQDNEAEDTQMNVLSFDAVNRRFTVEVIVPHCVEPSTLPSSAPFS